MPTKAEITAYTDVMKEYYIQSYQRDAGLLRSFFGVPYAVIAKGSLLSMELRELKAIVFETNKELRTVANEKLKTLRDAVYPKYVAK